MMRRALSMLVAVSSFGLVGPAAHATYPGRNGRIAFTVLHYHPGGPATFTAASVTPAGRERRALGPIADVSWSATGRRLVAITPSSAPPACPTCGTGTTLVLADARGRVVRRIPTPGVIPYAPVLAPDGQTLAFVQYVSLPGVDEQIPWIWTVRTDGTALRRLTTGEHPLWRPDGRRIVFNRQDHAIAWMRPDGSGAAVLVAARADAALLDVAPGGQRLLWAGRPAATRHRGLYVSDLHGGRVHALAGRRAGLSAVWSPDGRSVAFTLSGAGTFTVPVDGGHPRRIARSQLQSLAWQPRAAA